AVELDVEEGAGDVSELVTVDRDARVERQRETEALLVPELPLHADVRRVEAEVVLSLVDGHAVRPRHELAPLRVAARQPDARLERREEAIVELRIEEDLVAIEEAHAVDVRDLLLARVVDAEPDLPTAIRRHSRRANRVESGQNAGVEARIVLLEGDDVPVEERLDHRRGLELRAKLIAWQEDAREEERERSQGAAHASESSTHHRARAGRLQRRRPVRSPWISWRSGSKVRW